MDQLIPVINRLHDAFSLTEGGAPIDLPQIVVVGSQSAGKSSVLENLVGKDFLPRGSNIVTRRPLILQLINQKKKNGEDLELEEWSDGLEYGEFLHKQNEKFYDFNEIREEIKRETDRITGSNKGISPIPINLKIYSPNVLNLTLVDLPGVTKVPVGDQPKDIELQIRRMIIQYIEKPNTIILAITAANTDLATSDALQMARLVDPECKRTIGVLTKLDLMDKGTDALDMLMGRIVPLKLGFVGVINRSQKDINDNKAIKESLNKEKEFFNSHPIYTKLAGKCGTQYLASKCTQILMNHIRNCLPDLRQKINQMVQTTSDELRNLGDNSYDFNQGALLLQIISAFSSNYSQMIEGKVSDDVSVESLYGGARINFIFNEIYSKYLLSLSPLEGLSAMDIRTAMSNATGPKSALFVPESAFELLVRRQLGRIKEPAIQCVDLVFDELDRIVHNVDLPELQRFANLREEITDAAMNLVRLCREPTKEMIQNILLMELSFINTNHPNFKVDTIISGVIAKRQQAQQAQEQITTPTLNTFEQSQMQNRGSVPPIPPKGNTNPPSKQTSKQAPPMFHESPPKESTKDSGSFFGMWFQNKNKDGTTTGQYQPTQQFNQPNNSISIRSSERQQKHQQVVPQNLNKLQQPPTNLNVSLATGKEFEIQLLESLLESYFNIVRTNLIDAVPKSIMYFLVTKSKQQMQNELVQALYKDQNFDRLFEESSDIVNRRRTARNMLEVLTKAQNIINEVRDYKLPQDKQIQKDNL